MKENQEIENFLNALLIILLSPVHGFLQYLTKKERGFWNTALNKEPSRKQTLIGHLMKMSLEWPEVLASCLQNHRHQSSHWPHKCGVIRWHLMALMIFLCCWREVRQLVCDKICNTSSKAVFLDIIRSIDSKADNIVAPNWVSLLSWNLTLSAVHYVFGGQGYSDTCQNLPDRDFLCLQYC